MKGYAVKLGDAVVNWAAKKQTSVALSTCETEYSAMSVAAQETVWMRKVLKEFERQVHGSTELKSDNVSCISWSSGKKILGKCAKHIDVRVHHIRDLVKEGTISISYVPSEENDANLLTKPLSRGPLNKIMDCISLIAAVEEGVITKER